MYKTKAIRGRKGIIGIALILCLLVSVVHPLLPTESALALAGWVVDDEVDLEIYSGTYSSLAFHPSTEYPSMAHYDGTHLKFTFWNGLEWVNTIVDDTDGVGEFCSLAIGPSGNPAISYRDGGNCLLYASWD